MSRSTTTTLEQPFDNVKPVVNSILPKSPASVIHHNVSLLKREKIIVSYSTKEGKRYGVSRSRRVLSPQLLFKQYDLVRDCLKGPLALTTAQREVILRLLRLRAYYGQVYPKEAFITKQPGCKKATFWRTIKLLEDMGLLTRVNRFVLRPHAQISNLYRLDKLVVMIAKYLAEHIGHVWPDWLEPYLATPWPSFWRFLKGDQLKLPYPSQQ